MKPWFGYHMPNYTFRDVPPEPTPEAIRATGELLRLIS